MFHNPISRRALIGLGTGAAAALWLSPNTLAALGSLSRAPAPVDSLDVAIKAAKWIRRSRVTTKNGVAWPADPAQPATVGFDLYNGTPGVILFHLELFYATGDDAWLADAKLGADELAAQLPALDRSRAAGLYNGMAGAVFVLEETHRATKDQRYRDAAKQALAMIHAQAQRTTLGASWTGPSATNDIVSGTAGIGLLLLWADQMFDDPPSRELALAAGRQLLDAGIAATAGTKWSESRDSKILYPNFSHGTAGICYFLATLMQVMEDRSGMAAALSGVQYLESVANTEGGGFKVFHHAPGGENVYAMSWSDGPAGTARLFRRIGQITERPRWDDLTRRSAKAIIASGAPEKPPAVAGNNASQCCGNAGIGEFFIDLQRWKPDPTYADMIARVQRTVLDRATVDGDGLKWLQTGANATPQAASAQTGYMQGAAGIGSFYLHADALAKGRAPQIRWPDSPAFDPCPPAAAATDMSRMAGGRSTTCSK